MAIKALLCSLDDLKAYLGITETGKDKMLNGLLEYVTKLFQTLTGRVIPKGQYTEYHDGTERQWFYVDNYPIVSITSVHWDSDCEYLTEDLVDSDDYAYDTDSGRVWKKAGTWAKGLNAIKIIYTAGYSKIPRDIVFFAKKLAAQEFKRADEDRIGMTSQSFGDSTTAYDVRELPSDLALIVEKYKREI